MIPLQIKVKSDDNNTTSLSFSDDILALEQKKKIGVTIKPTKISSRYILSVYLDKSKDARIIIKALIPQGKLTLKLTSFSFEAIDEEAAKLWTRAVNDAVYKDVKKAKHFKVFINPFGGAGKAETSFNQSVKPIFDAAGCTCEITLTEYSKNAKDIVKDLDLKAYDAIVTVSGDGIIHEVINGLLSRDDALEIDIPIGVIPSGSGNGLSFCLLGNDYGNSLSHAALNVIKGVSMKIDICSVTQGKERYYSFLSLNYGILADCDLATEHLRFMKDLRFVVGAIQALLANRKYSCEIAMKIVEDNIEKVKQGYRKGHEYSVSHVKDELKGIADDHKHDRKDHYSSVEDKSKGIVDKYGSVNDPIPSDWTVLNDDGYIFIAGKVPWLSRGQIIFPCALPSDGLLDLMMVHCDKTSKLKVASVMTSFEQGTHINMKEVCQLTFLIELLISILTLQ
ncbi:ATP-NAD kinase-like domain-containing protein [Glomus cerebriforme]|uniref:ATP-NAD kinase-like domain-containing protein n=1 Tax=Glomus cerebriforme TaxID=658196 RepID=A0A397T6B6_9GLOM|nr:ATP-NAD kinase-like domain-containing protein [Glomus cerebriforme]